MKEKQGTRDKEDKFWCEPAASPRDLTIPSGDVPFPRSVTCLLHLYARLVNDMIEKLSVPSSGRS